jgi:hypothetical protein
MANIQKLANERVLVLAGPYGKEKSDPMLRGLFVFATPDAARAKEIAETDPGFAAGVFRFDYHALATDAPLRDALEVVLAAQAADQAAGRTRPHTETMRSYVLLTAGDGVAARAALAGQPFVFWSSQLDGDRALLLLDAETSVAAREMLAPFAGRLGAHTLDDWYATKQLAELPAMANAAATTK